MTKNQFIVGGVLDVETSIINVARYNEKVTV
jgi:hypothetical protein